MTESEITNLDDSKFHKDITANLYPYEILNQENKTETLSSEGAVKTAPFTPEAKTGSVEAIEKAINAFLVEVGLRPNQRELIRAFLHISKGNPYFEASHKDLAVIVYGQNALKNTIEGKRATDSIRNNIKTLLKWQEENELEIIRIVVLGNRIKTDDGQFKFNKSKFHLMLLDEILKLISAVSSESYEVRIEEVIAKLIEQYQPVERRKSYHPNHKIQKAGKTLLTTLENIFNWNREAKSDPIKSCERFLRQLNEKFNDLLVNDINLDNSIL